MDEGYSKRGKAFLEFSADVLGHIEDYTIPQYGDKGEYQVTNYTVKDCLTHVGRYIARYGKNQREGQQELDFFKAAHYIQLAYEKYKEEKDASDSSQI